MGPSHAVGAAPAGVFSWGLQAMLFALLLFALLSADTDPLTYTFRVLPLTDAAREQVRHFDSHRCEHCIIQPGAYCLSVETICGACCFVI